MRPLRQRWERGLQRWDDERPNMQRQLDQRRSQNGSKQVSGPAAVGVATSRQTTAAAPSISSMSGDGKTGSTRR